MNDNADSIEGIAVTHGPLIDDTPDEESTPATTTDADDDGHDEEDGRDVSKTAKLRRRAQAAEAERDALLGQVDALRKQVVEYTSSLSKPTALWAVGTDVAALFDAGGRLDPAKLAEAEAHAVETLGCSRATRTPKPDPSIGCGMQGRSESSWGAVLM